MHPIMFEYRPEGLPALQAAMLSAFEAGAPQVVLNLDPLERLDTEGVRGLILLLRRSREIGGELALNVTRPEIILYDSPTGGLDPTTSTTKRR